jgi:hypothetical protein
MCGKPLVGIIPCANIMSMWIQGAKTMFPSETMGKIQVVTTKILKDRGSLIKIMKIGSRHHTCGL